MISVISGDNVALLTGRILAAFGRPEDIPVGHNDPGWSLRGVMRPGVRHADRLPRSQTRDPQPRYDAANRTLCVDQPSFNGPFRFNDEAYRVTG